jgi:hypothetical protein
MVTFFISGWALAKNLLALSGYRTLEHFRKNFARLDWSMPNARVNG